jgi:glycosyltransferase involved in cell wall biosynthesis
MRIVVFSDLYPPLFLGGYEIGAAHVVAELRRRGHEVLLLTSAEYFLQEEGGFRRARHNGTAPAFLDAGLCVFGSLPRLLRTHPIRFLRGVVRTLAARRRYRRAVAAFRPERVLLFNPLAVVAPVLRDLTELAHQAGAEVHAYISDDWLATWPAIHPLLRPLHRLRHSSRFLPRLVGRCLAGLLGRTAWGSTALPQIDRFFFCSEHLRRVCRERAAGTVQEVLPWGLPDVERLPQPSPVHFRGPEPLTLLFAGQIQEHKGLVVLLRALAALRRPHRLLVFGDDTTPHAAECKRLCAELRLSDRVRFLGKKPHAEMLALLGEQGHLLVVPSLWDEPFGLVVTEGMALGLPVVASNRGGPAETIRHGETGFLFASGDSTALAALLDRLEEDRELCRRVGLRARRAVLRDYTIERMVDRLLTVPAAPETEITSGRPAADTPPAEPSAPATVRRAAA